MKSFNGKIVAAALIGLVFSPGIVLAQAQPIASVTRLVPLDITGHYVVPAINPALNPARHQLLTADPFKEAFAAAVTPVVVPRGLSPRIVPPLRSVLKSHPHVLRDGDKNYTSPPYCSHTNSLERRFSSTP